MRCFLPDPEAIVHLSGEVAQVLHGSGDLLVRQIPALLDDRAWTFTALAAGEETRRCILAEAPEGISDRDLRGWIELLPGTVNALQALVRAGDSRSLRLVYTSIMDGFTQDADPRGRILILYTTSMLARAGAPPDLGKRIFAAIESFVNSPAGRDCVYVRQTDAGKALVTADLFEELKGDAGALAYPGWYAASLRFVGQSTRPEVWIVVPPGPFGLEAISPLSTLRRLEFSLILANPHIAHVHFVTLKDTGTGFILEPGPRQDKWEALKSRASGHLHLIHGRP
ncbi:MAG: hypothetical protein M3O22_07580 [Pseudomonadota bacterium]|nr:hypothetical protein [Pseudomonadota bacterium]